MLVYMYTCIRIYAGVHVCLCVYIMECIRVSVGVHVYVACVYGYVCECFMCVLILLPLFVFGGVL